MLHFWVLNNLNLKQLEMQLKIRLQFPNFKINLMKFKLNFVKSRRILENFVNFLQSYNTIA